MIGMRRKSASLEADPTPERLRRAQGNVAIGDDGYGHRIMQFRDTPLERARARGAITEKQYEAAQKFSHHWHRAGLCGALHSLDPDRVYSSGMGNGLYASEDMEFHCQRVRAARKVVGEIVGGLDIMQWAIINERSLSDYAVAHGWKSRPKGIQAAEMILRRALQALVGLWGL